MLILDVTEIVLEKGGDARNPGNGEDQIQDLETDEGGAGLDDAILVQDQNRKVEMEEDVDLRQFVDVHVLSQNQGIKTEEGEDLLRTIVRLVHVPGQSLKKKKRDDVDL